MTNDRLDRGRPGPSVRELTWEGCLNIRDLGGLATEDGGRTRSRAVVRADSVRRLSDTGWRSLVEYGVGRIVDLRFHSDLAADPPRELPVEVVHVAVLPEPDAEQWTEIDEIADAAPDAARAARDVYLEFLERFPSGFSAAIEAVADAPRGAVVIHCHSGKDRTGLVAALLLRLAGVAIPDIAADYALSAANLRTLNERWIEEAADDLERGRRARISMTPAEAMEDVLHELERRYGSVRGYLLAAGNSDATIERVRARLRDG